MVPNQEKALQTAQDIKKWLVAVTYRRSENGRTTYTAHYAFRAAEVLRVSESSLVEPYGVAILMSTPQRNLCKGPKRFFTLARKSSKSTSTVRDGESARYDIVEETPAVLGEIFLAAHYQWARVIGCNQSTVVHNLFERQAREIAEGKRKLY